MKRINNKILPIFLNIFMLLLLVSCGNSPSALEKASAGCYRTIDLCKQMPEATVTTLLGISLLKIDACEAETLTTNGQKISKAIYRGTGTISPTLTVNLNCMDAEVQSLSFNTESKALKDSTSNLYKASHIKGLGDGALFQFAGNLQTAQSTLSVLQNKLIARFNLKASSVALAPVEDGLINLATFTLKLR